MKIYITGLPSGYEVEHLVRLFYPMAPLTLTPPEDAEDCVWAEKTPDGCMRWCVRAAEVLNGTHRCLRLWNRAARPRNSALPA